MRRLLFGTSLVLMLALAASGTAAQDDSPSPVPSASPAPTASEAEPIPVADYWEEWIGHKQASHERASRAIRDATSSRSKPSRWYQNLVGVHQDELRWLANHEPMDCYRREYEQWSDAVDDLHAIHKRALRSARAGKTAGLRQAAKDRREAMKRLNGALTNVAVCEPSISDTAATTLASDAMAGKWKTVQRFVNPNGADVTHQASTKIERDGRFLLRVTRDDFCRQRGFGFRPLTLSGQGDFLVEDGLQLTWANAKLHCYPRGGGRQLVLETGAPEAPWRYDQTYDVILGVQGPGNCSWRAKGGSPKDCKAFWRGDAVTTVDSRSEMADAVSPEEAPATPPPDA